MNCCGKAEKALNSPIAPKDNYYIVNGNKWMLTLEAASRGTMDAVLTLLPEKEIAIDRFFEGNDQLKTNTALQMKDTDITFITL